MIYVVNIEKQKNEKLGITLINKNNNVFIDNISEYPNQNIRDKLLIGDNIISINGIKSNDARYTCKYIIKSGPYLSICLYRPNNLYFENNFENTKKLKKNLKI